MEKEPFRRYIIFLAALIICAGVAWYFSKDAENPRDNAVLAGGRNLIIDLGTAGRGRKEETERMTEKETWEATEIRRTSDSSESAAVKAESIRSEIRDKPAIGENKIK